MNQALICAERSINLEALYRKIAFSMGVGFIFCLYSSEYLGTFVAKISSISSTVSRAKSYFIFNFGDLRVLISVSRAEKSSEIFCLRQAHGNDIAKKKTAGDAYF